MSIKNQIKIFNRWQKTVIGYDRYRTRLIKNDIAVDVYTKKNGYIKLKKYVTSEPDLIDVFVGIVDLYEGAESAGLYRKMVQK